MKYKIQITILLSLLVWASAHATECLDLLALNVNANKTAAAYQENNERGFSNYTNVLGEKFGDLFITPNKPLRWLDVGVGYGLATLQKVLSGEVAQATLINTQDNWNFLFSLEAPPDDFYLRHRMSYLGYRLNIPSPTEAIQGYQKGQSTEVWIDYIGTLKEKIAEAQKDNRYRYLVGFAEQLLPSVEGNQDILTDVFGAYVYSADRISLLEWYYNKLGKDGLGFVIMKSTPDDYAEFGAVNRVQGSILSFEQHLIRMYPRIFKIVRHRIQDQWIMVLEIERDPKVKTLDLKQHFEIIEAHLDENASQLMSQMPQVIMKLKTPLPK